MTLGGSRCRRAWDHLIGLVTLSPQDQRLPPEHPAQKPRLLLSDCRRKCHRNAVNATSAAAARPVLMNICSQEPSNHALSRLRRKMLEVSPVQTNDSTSGLLLPRAGLNFRPDRCPPPLSIAQVSHPFVSMTQAESPSEKTQTPIFSGTPSDEAHGRIDYSSLSSDIFAGPKLWVRRRIALLLPVRRPETTQRASLRIPDPTVLRPSASRAGPGITSAQC